jgi:hypothetical protein
VESGVRDQREVAEKMLFYYERQREAKEESKQLVTPMAEAAPVKTSSDEVIELLKDASSSFLKEISPEESKPAPEKQVTEKPATEKPAPSEKKQFYTRPPQKKAKPVQNAKKAETGLEFTHDMQEFLKQTFAEKEAKKAPEAGTNESDLDLATKVLWQIAEDATKLLVKEKPPLDGLEDAEVEEVEEA